MKYSGISKTPADKETIVGLQSKYLFMLVLLQNSDTRPTDQAAAAIEKLNTNLMQVLGRGK